MTLAARLRSRRLSIAVELAVALLTSAAIYAAVVALH